MNERIEALRLSGWLEKIEEADWHEFWGENGQYETIIIGEQE